MLRYEYIQLDEYERKWNNSLRIIKSNHVKLNDITCNNVYFFKKYIMHIILLNPEAEYDFINGYENL